MPSPGYRVSGKVEVRDLGSQHHQLCHCCNLQLIQSHVAPSHGPAARVLPPLFLWLQSLSCCLSRVAKRSTPKPCGPLPFPSEPHGLHFFTSEPRGLLFTSPKLPDPGPLPFPSEPRGSLPFALRTSWFSHLLWSRVVSSFLPQNLVVLPLLWLPRLGLNPSAHLPLQPHF